MTLQDERLKMKSRHSLLKIAAVAVCILVFLWIGRRWFMGHGNHKTDQQAGPISRSPKLLGGAVEALKQSSSNSESSAGRPTTSGGVEAWNETQAGQQPLRVPLRPGLMIVTAVATPDGDYESIKRIISVTDSEVRLTISSEIPSEERIDSHSQEFVKVVKHFSAVRTVRREDLRTARTYRQMFLADDPETFPGSTAIGTSAEVLHSLKQGIQTTLGYEMPDLGGPALDSWPLDRVEAHPVPFVVLVNNQRVELPAVHAQFAGISMDGNGKPLPMNYFLFLDDSENPIALKWELGKVIGRLQVINISFPTGSFSGQAGDSGGGRGDENGGSSGGIAIGNGQFPSSAAPGPGPAGVAPNPPAAADSPEIKRSLEDSGRAEVYGIYFDFRSAEIRPESEPVLKAIADLLMNHRSWKIRVEGHTDNIGGDVFNQDLSERRAAAVKEALVSSYHITASRITTAGYGASRPKESNDTLEGRARNRRVELIRQ